MGLFRCAMKRSWQHQKFPWLIDFPVISDHGFFLPFLTDFGWYLPEDFPGCYISVHQKLSCPFSAILPCKCQTSFRAWPIGMPKSCDCKKWQAQKKISTLFVFKYNSVVTTGSVQCSVWCTSTSHPLKQAATRHQLLLLCHLSGQEICFILASLCPLTQSVGVVVAFLQEDVLKLVGWSSVTTVCFKQTQKTKEDMKASNG